MLLTGGVFYFAELTKRTFRNSRTGQFVGFDIFLLFGNNILPLYKGG